MKVASAIFHEDEELNTIKIEFTDIQTPSNKISKVPHEKFDIKFYFKPEQLAYTLRVSHLHFTRVSLDFAVRKLQMKERSLSHLLRLKNLEICPRN